MSVLSRNKSLSRGVPEGVDMSRGAISQAMGEFTTGLNSARPDFAKAHGVHRGYEGPAAEGPA